MIEVWYEVELICIACSRDCGEVRVDRPNQPIYRERCVCGGMPIVRDIQQYKRHLYEPVELEKPRVGRPPKMRTRQP
jgi:hypothetical protein